MAAEFANSVGKTLMHPGLPEDLPEVFVGDLDTLARRRLIAVSRRHPDLQFYVTNQGFAEYRSQVGSGSLPENELEANVLRYLEMSSVRKRHPDALQKWERAASLLWESNEVEQHTLIGHLLREASIEFSQSLRRQLGIPPHAKSETKNAVGDALKRLGEGRTTEAVLLSLWRYWSATVDHLQRQEHGATKEGEPLSWEDSRQAVFHAAFVMTELDRFAVKAGR